MTQNKLTPAELIIEIEILVGQLGQKNQELQILQRTEKDKQNQILVDYMYSLYRDSQTTDADRAVLDTVHKYATGRTLGSTIDSIIDSTIGDTQPVTEEPLEEESENSEELAEDAKAAKDIEDAKAAKDIEDAKAAKYIEDAKDIEEESADSTAQEEESVESESTK